MMYQLTLLSTIIRSDGALIPADQNNRDYQDYLAWKSAGGVPTPVPLSDYQRVQSDKINASCQSAIFAGFTSGVRTYPAKTLDQQNLNASVTDALVALSSPAWAAATAYPLGALVTSGGQAYQCSVAGTSGAVTPIWPLTLGASAIDGTAQWQIWNTPFWSADSTGAWSYYPHMASQIKQVGRDAKSSILANLQKNQNYQSQIQAATTPSAVQAIVWV
ncbi:MAG: hypothetical protein NVSMB70_06270 [Chamaesiphon sp.]